MSLANQILSLFRGRKNMIAKGNGDVFEPWHNEAGMPADVLERQHLAGERCYGFYLLDTDNRCWCSCVDFDNKAENPDPQWRDKAEQLYVVLSHCQLSPLLELSQSGNAAHVWLFFSEPTDAWIPRAWWRSLAEKIDAKFGEVYPRQDSLSGKGLGNLVRYPLFNRSCFVDPENDWEPIDPVEALNAVRPTSATDLKLLAFQLGIAELKPDPKPTVTIAAEIGELLPLRVQKLIDRKGTLIGRRWAGDMNGLKDRSKSAVAMSIAVELVRLYVPTPEIASALRYWCRANGAEKKGDRDDWINGTVTSAYDFIIDRTESRSVDATTFQRACHLYLDQIENGQQPHLSSGISELDDSIDGIARGEVCIIAARPGHGKTALAAQWCDYASQHGEACLLISEEMSATEIGKRRLLSVSNVPQEQWVQASVPHMRGEIDEHHAIAAPVYVVENCYTIDRAEEIIDQFCGLHGVSVVAIDYLQLLGARSGDRYEVVTEISRRVKQATRRNGCRTILLSQLNREVEKRPDFEPRLSDLRESGQIEQDADLVLFAQWPCRFDSDIPEDEYRIWCAKRRNGPIRSPKIQTRFNASRQVFGSAALVDPFGVPTW
jgi:replicative DNA helicase